jgi:hypothetical protein
MLAQLADPIGVHEHDKDGDGLTNDEEDFLGTDPQLVDTDKDGVSDYLELRFQLNPLEPDAALDSDGDGYDSKTEVETGMDPHHQEPQYFRDRYALRLQRGDEFIDELPNPAGGISRVRTCYEFRVDNILYRAPLKPDGSQRDFNLFELSFIDQTRVPIGDTEFLSPPHHDQGGPQPRPPGLLLPAALAPVLVSVMKKLLQVTLLSSVLVHVACVKGYQAPAAGTPDGGTVTSTIGGGPLEHRWSATRCRTRAATSPGASPASTTPPRTTPCAASSPPGWPTRSPALPWTTSATAT